MKSFETSRAWADKHWDTALDIIRMFLGLVLITKAVFFMANRDQLISLIDQTGTMWFAPAAIAHYVIMAHFGGGFLLLIGLLTRFAAIIQIPILIGALFGVHLPRMLTLGAREPIEYTALVLFLVLVVSVYGAGRWSLDHYFAQHERELDVGQPAGTPA